MIVLKKFQRIWIAAMMIILSMGCSSSLTEEPNFSPTWPDLEWEHTTPKSAGFSPEKLQTVLEYVFEEGNYSGAFLIIHGGRIAVEEYSEGKTKDDMVTSWSVAKSVTSTLVGIAIEKGIIEGLHTPASQFLIQWADEPVKSTITVDQLMTLRTALSPTQTDPVGDSSAFYSATNQLQLALERPLIGTPGEKLYSYSNGDVQLIGGILEKATGYELKEWLNQSIGAGIGFQSEWWKDKSGSTMAYCCLDATPRSFARIGLMMARSGRWKDSQVLSESWFEISLKPSLNDTYGYYWWPLGNGGFGAFGTQGQVIAIYPTLDLVVLRFSEYLRLGDGRAVRENGNYHFTRDPVDFDSTTMLQLVEDALVH